MKKFKSGDIAPETGFYRIVDKNGNTLYKIMVYKGDRLPPVEESYYYALDF